MSPWGVVSFGCVSSSVFHCMMLLSSSCNNSQFTNALTFCHHSNSYIGNEYFVFSFCIHTFWPRYDLTSMPRMREGPVLRLTSKLGWSQTDLFPCNGAPMTTEFVLQDCPRQDALRIFTWAEAMPLRNKLYGYLAELRRTAAFSKMSGVTIWN